MRQNAGCAVRRECIVELGFFRQRIYFPNIIQKKPARIGCGGAGAIQINVLRWILPIVGPEPDQVAFVGDNVKQFVLLEEASDGRITLVLLPACLYGDREEIFPSKPEAQKNVSNRVSHPVRSNYVDGVEVPEIESFVVVARREIGFRSVIKVSDVVNGY